MNLLQLKYAVEVAKAGSINKASQTLLIAQPNLSRTIRDLEQSLGITIFERSSHGMRPTPDGEDFLKAAEKILHELDALEETCKSIHQTRQAFSISVPRASYISDAFIRFTNRLEPYDTEIYYDETNSRTAIENVLENRYNLAIVRYAAAFGDYFHRLFAEKDINYTLLTEYQYMLLMSKDSPLAFKEEICLRDLEPLIEIAHADPYVPFLSPEGIKRAELPANIRRRIFVYERGSQFELLSENTDSFMWVSPVPSKLLDCYGLVQRKCSDNKKTYRDVLISRKGYPLSALDKAFLQELHHSIQQFAKADG